MPLFYLHISCVFCLFYQLSKTFLMFEMLKPLDDDLSWYSAVYSGNLLIFSSFFLPSFLPPPPLSFFLESNLGHGICQEMILQLNHTSSTQEYRDKKVFPHCEYIFTLYAWGFFKQHTLYFCQLLCSALFKCLGVQMGKWFISRSISEHCICGSLKLGHLSQWGTCHWCV